MSENFDPYREALVIETKTLWPAELASVPAPDRQRIEASLHAGFCRQITVTAADVERLK